MVLVVVTECRVRCGSGRCRTGCGACGPWTTTRWTVKIGAGRSAYQGKVDQIERER